MKFLSKWIYILMFRFKEWFNTPVYEDIDFTIEEVPMSLVEAHILGYDTGTPDEKLRKYKVTFRSYKHKKAHQEKIHDNEVVYVIGDNPKEVRERIVRYIYERKDRFAKGSDSYKVTPAWIKDISRRDMSIRVKEIKTWNDLVDTLNYIAIHKPRFKDEFFTHHDLSILLNKYDKSRDFWADIQKMPKDIQLLLRRFLKIAIQDPTIPAHVKQRLEEPGRFTTGQNKGDLLIGGTKNMGKWFKDRELRSPDMPHNLHSYSTVAEINKAAKSYGISVQELRQRAMEIAAEKTYETEQDRKLWDTIHDHLRTVTNNKRNWQKQSLALDWSSPEVISSLDLGKLLAEVKSSFPRSLPGAKEEPLRTRLGMNLKMTTETRTPITTLSSVTLYKWLGGTDPASFATAVHNKASLFGDDEDIYNTGDEYAPQKTSVDVKTELLHLCQQKFTSNPDSFADFLNYILSNYDNTIPAVRLYHRARSTVGFSPALQMDFDTDKDGIHLIAKPNAEIKVKPTKSYISVNYRVEGGTTFGTTLFLYIIGSEEVEVKMTNITRMTK